MAKNVPLDAETLEWAHGLFAAYYRDHRIPAPERLNRREFAAFPFSTETFMRRHETLRTVEEFERFLARESPRHVYYSSAYYRHPAEASMSAKEWLGADLIFDLDSDHLRGAAELDYAGQLALVKRRLVALVDDFLFGDFGIDPTTTSLVFSGGRGYHVHVRGEGLTSLSSPERRELVDYVLGTGVDPMRAVRSRREGADLGVPDSTDSPRSARGRANLPKARSLVPPDAPGWPGRTTRAVLDLLARWQTVGRVGASQEMVRAGVPTVKARRWAKMLLDEGGAERIRAGLSLDVFSQGVPEELLRAMVAQATIEVQGETDAPVTTDIHRLIRLPGSIHGGTGFRAVPIPRDRLAEFDPFRDAVLPTTPGDRTTVELSAKVRYPFPDGGVAGAPGESVELPTSQALFLVLRGEAAVRP